MSKVIVLGGGLCGLASALMLARDGHEVTVLERDPAPVPESPERAWEAWERGGVAQFRQAHYMQPRGRQVLGAELPDVLAAIREADAAELHWPRMMPPTIEDRSPRPGDEELMTVTARRPTLEQAMASAAERQDGLTVRRGAAVARLETRARDGAVHVTGVRTEDGVTLYCDLVVDATGRRSRMPALLREAGGPEAVEEGGDSGFVYYTRFFRSADGSTPAPRGPLNSPFESHSILTLPADAGTWSVTLYGAAADPPLKRFRHEPVWTAVMRASPLHAHWLEGEPMTGILPMGGVLDRRRRLPADGTLTGVALLADAWACTNPSVGRGMSFGLMHGALLRDTLREHDGRLRGVRLGVGRGDRARDGAVVRGDRGRRPRSHGPAAGGARRRPVRRPRRPGVAAARRAAAGDGRRRRRLPRGHGDRGLPGPAERGVRAAGHGGARDEGRRLARRLPPARPEPRAAARDRRHGRSRGGRRLLTKLTVRFVRC